MGMTIDAPFIAHSELTDEIYVMDKKAKYCVTDQVMKAVVATNRAIPKAQYDELKANITMMRLDYEARLKADMVAMLTEIQLEIEELDSRAGYDGGGMPTFSTDYIRKKKVNDLIQQKIDKLKENTDVL